MKVIQQRNVYFVDLGKCIYRGFIETAIERDSGENVLVYRSKDLDILKVDIIASGKLRVADYMSRDATAAIDKNEASFSRNMWKNISSEGILEVQIPEEVKEDTFTVRVLYKAKENNNSIEFYKPVSSEDKHKEIVASNRMFDSSSIFPSFSVPYKSKWELVYILPSNDETKIISPGILKSIKEEEDVILYSYVVDMAYSGAINFCIGTFDSYEVSTGDDRKAVCIPKGFDGYKDCVREFCCDVENLIRYSEYFLQREYPFKALSIAFVFGDADKVYGESTAFLALSNLTFLNDIEPMFLLKRIICDILSSQIFYFYFSVVERADFWISEGMKGYFEDYCVRHFLGNNEFLYGLKKDKDYILDRDVTEYALYDTRRTFFSMREKFFKTKSKVFFHLLEGNLSRAFMEKILNYTIKKKSDVRENYSFEFVKLVKDVTGKDLRSLFETYVFRPGVVKVRLGFTINKKNNRVDFTASQIPTSIFSNGNKTISGPVTICSYEMEGIFEHVFMLDRENHFYYHPKTKKKKKSEEEEEVMPLLWIRADTKGEHLAKIVIEQPDYMFIEQLLDKNIIGQMEALENLSIKPSTHVCEIFERMLENTHIFYKIRIHILYILSRTIVGSYYGFQRLIQYFVKKYCVQTSTIVKPNDFSFIPYFIQKHLVKALSYADPFVFKNYSGREVGSASIISAFIINILKFNDNSFNSYSDGWYISSVIESLSFPLSSMSFSEFYSDKYTKFKGEGYSSRGKEKAGDDINELFKVERVDAKDSMPGSSISGINNKKSTDTPSPNEDYENTPSLYSSANNSDIKIENNKSSEEHKKGEKTEPLENPDYLHLSISEIERFRILDMVFPSHRNLVSKSCLYALGRISLFGMASLRKNALIQLSKYPNFCSIRVAALEVLLALFYEDEEVVEEVLEMLEKETFTIKCMTFDIMITLGLSPKFGFKKVLKGKRKKMFRLLRLNQGSITIKEKITSLIYLIEDMELTRDDYQKAVAKVYEDTLPDDLRKTINRLGREFMGDRHTSLKLSSMGVLKRKLLQTEYLIRIPISKRSKLSRKSMVHKEESLHVDASADSPKRAIYVKAPNRKTVEDMKGLKKHGSKNNLRTNVTNPRIGTMVRIPSSFKVRLKHPEK
ncbi:transcription initiation factor TFIID subunit 2 [Encephalitozoon hellem]|uniref:Transcription initiation factor TFIID subunit 2 n=1 Tax=Encephalitozoon hellem TaxID=27973 RepID=A0ABY8CPB2_ENCHE|nr:transcription initiation factor TFIID subunit 2 [Encephalitozoon hellem]